MIRRRLIQKRKKPKEIIVIKNLQIFGNTINSISEKQTKAQPIA